MDLQTRINELESNICLTDRELMELQKLVSDVCEQLQLHTQMLNLLSKTIRGELHDVN